MKAKFAVLRQILLDLGFQMRAGPDFIRFDHPVSKSWFLYPLYADNEEVTVAELAAARYSLDMKGFLSRQEFEDLLRQKVVAG